MLVTMLLADFAQVSDGKLTVADVTLLLRKALGL